MSSFLLSIWVEPVSANSGNHGNTNSASSVPKPHSYRSIATRLVGCYTFCEGPGAIGAGCEQLQYWNVGRDVPVLSSCTRRERRWQRVFPFFSIQACFLVHLEVWIWFPELLVGRLTVNTVEILVTASVISKLWSLDYCAANARRYLGPSIRYKTS